MVSDYFCVAALLPYSISFHLTSLSILLHLHCILSCISHRTIFVTLSTRCLLNILPGVLSTHRFPLSLYASPALLNSFLVSLVFFLVHFWFVTPLPFACTHLIGHCLLSFPLPSSSLLLFTPSLCCLISYFHCQRLFLPTACCWGVFHLWCLYQQRAQRVSCTGKLLVRPAASDFSISQFRGIM